MDEALPAARRAPTMADVARRARVSTAAVSYYLSGDGARLKRVGIDARLRIEEAVAALGYVQNGAARQLRRRQAGRICLVLPHLGVPYSDRIAQDVQAAAEQRGLSLIIVAGPDSAAVQRIFRDIEGGLADGVIADLQHLTAEDLMSVAAGLASLRKPMILFHPTAVPDGFSVFRQDAATAVETALRRLYDAGHRRIAYMRHAALGERTRMNAYLAFHDAVGLALDETLMVDGAESRRNAHVAALALLSRPQRPTALVAESDFAAVTALNTFQGAGLRVPDDMAVIGCGNIDEGRFSHPRLTTIGPQSAQFSHLAIHVADLIEGKPVSRTAVFELPWSVIPRESA